MEKKTIGGFIAALRKANGMTQKDLAERLNVSDKTVSRWERDDGAPDLSLIPVMAEIFDVTCDELLRGERSSPEQRAEPSGNPEHTAKGEKQRQRILKSTLSQYQSRTYITMGISAAGLVAAMVCNLGFLRAILGFCIGTVFYLAGIVCQGVFANSALLSVSDDGLSTEELGRFKKAVIRYAERSIGLTSVLFFISLPLVVFTQSAYAGLTAGTWLSRGLIYGLLALVIVCVVCYFLNAFLLKKKVYTLSEAEDRAYRRNHKLKRKCAVILAAALLVTYGVHVIVSNRWNVITLSDGTEFYDYQSFAEFMEQDLDHPSYSTAAPMPAAPSDEYGNEINEEELYRYELCLSDGTVVCSYLKRNGTVAHIRYAETDSLLPIKVVTYDGLAVGKTRYALITGAFAVLYCLEIAAAFVSYFKKRAA